jgi:alkanesulfonate monooxygenase SsuD/methylene tetrahydromethanopterin reductase-like flavin-dependent oxidoreductase (luciferase family)
VVAQPVTSTRLTDRFGIIVNVFTFGLPSGRLFAHVGDITSAIDSTAFDTLWLPDHLVQGPVGDIGDDVSPRTPIFDALTLLGALAVMTERVRIGPLVSPITIRNPGVLAKSVTTTDVVSDGRAVLGIGAAWDSDEHRRYGLDFPGPGERVSRLDDAVQICRKLFDDEFSSHSGQFFSVDEAVNVPRPVSEHVPILVGGSGHRTLRIAAAHADACNPIGTTREMREAFELFDRHCEEVGRDTTTVSKQAGIMFSEVDQLYGRVEKAFGIGADGIILVPWQLALGPDDVYAIGERLRTEFG